MTNNILRFFPHRDGRISAHFTTCFISLCFSEFLKKLSGFFSSFYCQKRVPFQSRTLYDYLKNFSDAFVSKKNRTGAHTSPLKTYRFYATVILYAIKAKKSILQYFQLQLAYACILQDGVQSGEG